MLGNQDLIVAVFDKLSSADDLTDWDENTYIDEDQNLKDFIVDDKEDSESDGWWTYVKNVIYKIY